MNFDPLYQNLLMPRDARWKRRAELFDGLLNGKIPDPEAAEQIAAAEGLGPLMAPLPEPWVYEACNPLRRSRWSLSMAVCWIAWRDLERVRNADNEFRMHRYHWMYYDWRNAAPNPEPRKSAGDAESRGGWRLEQWKKQTLLGLRIEESYEDVIAIAKPKMSINSARDALWAAASKGEIVGEAIRARDNEVVDIPQREWRLLQDGEYRDEEVLRLEHTGHLATYTDVVFSTARLMELWTRDEDHPPGFAAPVANDAHQNKIGLVAEPQSQHLALIEIIKALWPSGVPARSKLRAKQRDQAIVKACQGSGITLPAEPKSLATAVQRALRAIRSDRSDKANK